MFDLTLEQPGNQVINTSGLAQQRWARTQNTQLTQKGFIWCLVEILFFFISDLVVYRGRNGMSTNIKFSFYMPMTQWAWIWSPEKYPTAVNLGGVTQIWGLLGYWSCMQLSEVWLQLLWLQQNNHRSQRQQADGIVGAWSHRWETG